MKRVSWKMPGLGKVQFKVGTTAVELVTCQKRYLAPSIFCTWCNFFHVTRIMLLSYYCGHSIGFLTLTCSSDNTYC